MGLKAYSDGGRSVGTNGPSGLSKATLIQPSLANKNVGR